MRFRILLTLILLMCFYLNGISQNPLSGSYTINKNLPTSPTNFNSFSDAISALQNGISSPVLFSVESGLYNERIRISKILGTSVVNTITFQSATNNASDVEVVYNVLDTLNYTLQLDSADNIIFKNLTFKAENLVNGRVVDMKGTSSNNAFLNNIIIAPVVTTAANTTSAIYIYDLRGENNILKGNRISNGSYGIFFSGTSVLNPAKANTLSIENNLINSTYNNSIHAFFTTKTKILNNTINISGARHPNSVGIFSTYNDSAFIIKNNTVNINNTNVAITGIHIQVARKSVEKSLLSSNVISADSNNSFIITGINISNSESVNVYNNVIKLNSFAVNAYGIYGINNANQTNSDTVNICNNSVYIATVTSNSYAAYFSTSATQLSPVFIYNNVFVNKSNGKALYVNVINRFFIDYNLLFTSGPNLVQVLTPAANYPNLKNWITASQGDRNSLTIDPSFISSTDLKPDTLNSLSWAINGRGTQTFNNDKDFYGNNRPNTLTSGVPDIGAYEFYPAVKPPALLATPTNPSPYSTQVFSLGTDTVQRITWGNSVPANFTLRRYSGDVNRIGKKQPIIDSMFFYTQADTLLSNNFSYTTTLHYYDSWLGSILNEEKLGLGFTENVDSLWRVSFTSQSNMFDNAIYQKVTIKGIDKFTGFTNPYSITSDDSSLNRGTDFWVSYQKPYEQNSYIMHYPEMVLYLGAGNQGANVTVTIEGKNVTPWIKNYIIPANTVIASDYLPQGIIDTGNVLDARLMNEGLYEKLGIHIESNVPVAAYAHSFTPTNSAGMMLLPTSSWGDEFYTLNATQSYSPSNNAHSAIQIIAQQDSTWLEFNPSNPSLSGLLPNGGSQSNGSYLIKLNKGDIYQILGANMPGSSWQGYDLSGSYIKVVPNAEGIKQKIGVFAGSTRTVINCNNSLSGAGDLLIQQVIPISSWGKLFITAPVSNSEGPIAGFYSHNKFRIMVNNPNTVVKRNNVVLTGIINGRYYEYISNVPSIIEASDPVLVAQYILTDGGGCMVGTYGDPEIFYLTPLNQSISKTIFYRANTTDIKYNFTTLIVPTIALSTLYIDGFSVQQQPVYPIVSKHIYTNALVPNYSFVTLKWGDNGTNPVGFTKISCSYGFTGIFYGYGPVDSYGYNLGINKNYFQPPTMPVTFFSFSGENKGQQNKLGWTTLTEINNAGFELQRSNNGVDFSKIDFINSKSINGNASEKLEYVCYDNELKDEINYYRLKQMDKDGKFAYSNIVKLESNKKISGIKIQSVYPNPVKDKININLTSEKAQYITLYITDAIGKILMQKNVTLISGKNALDYSVGHISSGSYYIKVISSDGTPIPIQKFLKQ